MPPVQPRPTMTMSAVLSFVDMVVFPQLRSWMDFGAMTYCLLRYCSMTSPYMPMAPGNPIIVHTALLRLPPYIGSAKYPRSEEHTSELQSLRHLVCRLLLEKKKTSNLIYKTINLLSYKV